MENERYLQFARAELAAWKQEMALNPSLFSNMSKGLQNKLNALIPEKVHKTITSVVEKMVQGVLFGSGKVTRKPQPLNNLELAEKDVQNLIKIFRGTAAAEGGFTGAGGFLMSLADFPALVAIKIKMLFDIAAKYGFDTDDYKERLFLLHIFQLAFSSDKKRKETFLVMRDWQAHINKLPESIKDFDWRSFQQEYRDYLDLAKMAQLIPVIGAAVGFVVNYRLVNKLGKTAMMAYRMRVLG